MEDLNRLLALMKYCSDHVDLEGLETLHDLVAEKVPFDSLEHDIDNACEVAYHTLHTLYDVEFDDGVIYGKPKLNLEGLMGDLILLLERMANFRESQADEWPNG